MNGYIVYFVVFLAFFILFIRAHGFFKASSRLLVTRFPQLAEAGETVVARVLAIIFLAAAIGFLMTLLANLTDTAVKGYIYREENGGGDYEEDLNLTLGEKDHEVKLKIREQELTKAELEIELERAMNDLEELVFGDCDISHVDRDLHLPESIEGHSVRIMWLTDHPEYISWDGELGDSIPESGADMELTAEMTLEDESISRTFVVTVFPGVLTEEEQLKNTVQAIIDRENDGTDTKVTLPSTVNGEPASWSKPDDGRGVTLLFLGILIGLVYFYSGIRKKGAVRDVRDKQMVTDYPHIVNKLVLLKGAGLSTRQALVKMSADYRKTRKLGGEVRWGYEEIVHMVSEMDHGISEYKAYEHMGQRVRVMRYKTLSTILMQNLKKGGNEMTWLLSREAGEAFDDRKKRAKVLGEEAGTKLLLPMAVMLIIVMVILIVPAMFTFYS